MDRLVQVAERQVILAQWQCHLLSCVARTRLPGQDLKHMEENVVEALMAITELTLRWKREDDEYRGARGN